MRRLGRRKQQALGSSFDGWTVGLSKTVGVRKDLIGGIR